jgi:transcriptional regulator GlxA family with amidase domain
MVAIDDAQILDLVGPLEVFARASRLFKDQGRCATDSYVVEIIAHRVGPITMSSGLRVHATRSFAQVRGGVDTLLVAGGRGIPRAIHDAATIAFVRRMAPRVRRLGSVCTGAFVLAEAGLVDGKCVTTHWRAARDLATRYPSVIVDPDPVFIRQGNIYTSAGVTAGMDLALALVEEDHGAEAARDVARELVMFVQRQGGQSQFSVLLAHQRAEREPIAALQTWIAEHLAEDLSVASLARRCAMSPRNFARLFSEQVGTTPRRYVEELRVEAGRRRLEQTRDPVERIADHCGFGNVASMRRVFARHLRIAPSAYRARFARRSAASLRAERRQRRVR